MAIAAGIVFLTLYLLASVFLVRWVARYARAKKKNVRRWGWSTAAVLYLLVFWDWIPAIVMNQYSCAAEGGVWIYKTPDQWAASNPGELKNLVPYKTPILVSHQGDESSWTNVEMLNKRIKFVGKQSGPLFIHRWRWEAQLLDAKTNELLARTIDFYMAPKRLRADDTGWKFWLRTEHCPGFLERAESFRSAMKQLHGVEK